MGTVNFNSMKSKYIRTFFLHLTAGFLIFLSNGCKKDDGIPEPQIPVVETRSVSGITPTTATIDARVTSGNGYTEEDALIETGVCWGSISAPTIANNKIKTTSPVYLVNYFSLINGLTPNTTYFVRAYASNSIGTGYGEVLSFTTLSPVSNGTVTDIDGNVYNTIAIGSQEWMVENLKTTKFNDGTAIPNVTSGTAWGNLSTGAYCNYNNDTITSATYGKLYNWYAVTDSRKICPTGWHIPSDAEWSQLTENFEDEELAGGKLKEVGTMHWKSPNSGANNSSGFSALPGGSRYSTGTFGSIGYFGVWWSATGISNTDNAKNFYLSYGSSGAFRSNGSKKDGFSIRCVK